MATFFSENFALTLAASALKLYPISNKMIIFSIPLIILMISGGIQLIFNFLKEYRVIAWTVIGFICIFVSYGSIRNTGTYIENPEQRYTEHIKPLIEILEENRSEDEPLYVYYSSRPAYQYYQTISERDDHMVFYSEKNRSEPTQYIEEIKALSDYSTVWLLFSHNHGNEQSSIIDYFEEVGSSIAVYHEIGASLWKFQLHTN